MWTYHTYSFLLVLLATGPLLLLVSRHHARLVGYRLPSLQPFIATFLCIVLPYLCHFQCFQCHQSWWRAAEYSDPDSNSTLDGSYQCSLGQNVENPNYCDSTALFWRSFLWYLVSLYVSYQQCGHLVQFSLVYFITTHGLWWPIDKCSTHFKQ